MGIYASKQSCIDEMAITYHENSVFGSDDDAFTTSYKCTDGRCNFDTALAEIKMKYPQLANVVNAIDLDQDKIQASQVKNIIMHDAKNNLAILHHDTTEPHKLNVCINVNCLK